MQNELSGDEGANLARELLAEASSNNAGLSASIGGVARGNALLWLTRQANASERTERAVAAKQYLTTAAGGRPATARLWRSYTVAELLSSGPTPRLGAVSEAALQLDGGNAFTVITLVELAIRYPQLHRADTLEALLQQVQKLEAYWVMRRPLGRLYAGLSENDRQTLLSVSKNPKQIERWARPYLD